jgi:hypothetical protein
MMHAICGVERNQELGTRWLPSLWNHLFLKLMRVRSLFRRWSAIDLKLRRCRCLDFCY